MLDSLMPDESRRHHINWTYFFRRNWKMMGASSFQSPCVLFSYVFLPAILIVGGYGHHSLAEAQETAIVLKWCPRTEGSGETPISCVRPNLCPETRLLWTGGGALGGVTKERGGAPLRRVATCGEDGRLVCCLPPPAALPRLRTSRRRTRSPESAQHLAPGAFADPRSYPEYAESEHHTSNKRYVQAQGGRPDNHLAKGDVQEKGQKDGGEVHPSLAKNSPDFAINLLSASPDQEPDDNPAGPSSHLSGLNPLGAPSPGVGPSFWTSLSPPWIAASRNADPFYTGQRPSSPADGQAPPAWQYQNGNRQPNTATPNQFDPRVHLSGSPVYAYPPQPAIPQHGAPYSQGGPRRLYLVPRRGPHYNPHPNEESPVPQPPQIPMYPHYRPEPQPQNYPHPLPQEIQNGPPRSFAGSTSNLQYRTQLNDMRSPVEGRDAPLYETQSPARRLGTQTSDAGPIPPATHYGSTLQRQENHPPHFSNGPNSSPRQGAWSGTPHPYEGQSYGPPQGNTDHAVIYNYKPPSRVPGTSGEATTQVLLTGGISREQGIPSDGVPVDGVTIDGTPMDRVPVGSGSAMYRSPVDGVPMKGAPVYGRPFSEPPTTNADMDSTSKDTGYQEARDGSLIRWTPQGADPQQIQGPSRVPMAHSFDSDSRSSPQVQNQAYATDPTARGPHQSGSYSQPAQVQPLPPTANHWQDHYMQKMVEQQQRRRQKWVEQQEQIRQKMMEQEQKQQYQQQYDQKRVEHLHQKQPFYQQYHQTRIADQLRIQPHPEQPQQPQWEPQQQQSLQHATREISVQGEDLFAKALHKGTKWVKVDKPSADVSSVGVRSAQNCERYSHLAKKQLKASALLLDDAPIALQVSECDRHSPLIVGGQNATDNEFPHMAAIGFLSGAEIGWFCGGSIVSELYVLTAAHCTQTAWGQPLKVRLGTPFLHAGGSDLTTPKDAVDVNIAGVVVHPGYQPPARYNDIALLRLASPAPLSSKLRPACLPPPGEVPAPNSVALATGWGRLSYAGDSSEVLQKVALRVASHQDCARVYDVDRTTARLAQGVGPGMLCAGDVHSNRDTCQGDSGGPLQVAQPDNQCMYRIVGITSFGKECGLGLPAVYSRVSNYIDWIEDVVWPVSSGQMGGTNINFTRVPS